MLLSTGFLCALWMSCLGASSVPVGVERRVDAAISRSALKAKTRTQSSEHGVVATCEHRLLLSDSCVERHVRLLRGPDAMQQDGQLTRYRDNGLALGLLAASGGQMQAPLSKR